MRTERRKIPYVLDNKERKKGTVNFLCFQDAESISPEPLVHEYTSFPKGQKQVLITITIPPPTKRFSIYADGVLDAVVRLKEKSFVTLNDRYPITLYYRFGIHRHLYVCTSTSGFPNFPAKTLEGVPCPMAVLAELTGRAFDRYKRSMYRLKNDTNGKVMRLPPEFFWMLAQKCEQGKNAMKSVDRLMQSYMQI